MTLTPLLLSQELLIALPDRNAWRRVGSAVRIGLLGSCAVGYALLRMWLMTPAGASPSLGSASLAESQLIRRAENPLEFVSDRGSWLLSALYLQVSTAIAAPEHAGPRSMRSSLLATRRCIRECCTLMR